MEASTEKHDFPELFEKLDNLDLSGHFLQSLPNATGDYFGQYTAPISEISTIHFDGAEKDAIDREFDQVVLEARDYQKDIVEKAKDRNAIIFMDTGTGKTIVSIYLIDHYMKKFQKKRQIIYLANTQVLVEQQKNQIKRFLPKIDESHKLDEMNILALHGGISDMARESLHQSGLLRSFGVFICTPQYYLNALRRGYMLLEKVCLLIIDECQHTTKDHPFSLIMQEFWDTRIPGREYPYIIGLTASPVKTNETTEEKVRKKLLELCYTLDSNYVLNEAMMLKSLNQKNPRIFIHPYALDFYLENQLNDNILELADQQQLLALFLEGKAAPLDKKSYQLIINFLNVLSELDDNQSGFLSVYISKIKNRCLGVIMELGRYALYLHIDYLIEKINDKCADPNYALYKKAESFFLPLVCEILLKFKTKYMPKNPRKEDSHVTQKIQRLHEILKRSTAESFASMTNNENPVSMVFVSRRYIAKLVKDLIDHLGEGYELKSNFAIGHNNSKKGKPLMNPTLSLQKQMDTIHDFRRKKFNILVSTSLCEEGFDIPDCNLVVSFQEPLSITALIQAKGRARKPESSYFILIPQEKKIMWEGRIELSLKIMIAIKEISMYLAKMPDEDLKIFLKKNRESEFQPNKYFEVEFPKEKPGVLNTNWSIDLIRTYCQNIVACSIPTFINVTSCEPDPRRPKLYCSITCVPLESPILFKIGRPLNSTKEAQKSATFEMAKELEAKGFLDNHFYPKSMNGNNFFEFSEVIDWAQLGKITGISGRKRNNIKTKMLSEFFFEPLIRKYKQNPDTGKWIGYLYSYKLNYNPSMMEKKQLGESFGLLSPILYEEELKLPPNPFTYLGQVEISKEQYLELLLIQRYLILSRIGFDGWHCSWYLGLDYNDKGFYGNQTEYPRPRHFDLGNQNNEGDPCFPLIICLDSQSINWDKSQKIRSYCEILSRVFRFYNRDVSAWSSEESNEFIQEIKRHKFQFTSMSSKALVLQTVPELRTIVTTQIEQHSDGELNISCFPLFSVLQNKTTTNPLSFNFPISQLLEYPMLLEEIQSFHAVERALLQLKKEFIFLDFSHTLTTSTKISQQNALTYEYTPPSWIRTCMEQNPKFQKPKLGDVIEGNSNNEEQKNGKIDPFIYDSEIQKSFAELQFPMCFPNKATLKRDTIKRIYGEVLFKFLCGLENYLQEKKFNTFRNLKLVGLKRENDTALYKRAFNAGLLTFTAGAEDSLLYYQDEHSQNWDSLWAFSIHYVKCLLANLYIYHQRDLRLFTSTLQSWGFLPFSTVKLDMTKAFLINKILKENDSISVCLELAQERTGYKFNNSALLFHALIPSEVRQGLARVFSGLIQKRFLVSENQEVGKITSTDRGEINIEYSKSLEGKWHEVWQLVESLNTQWNEDISNERLYLLGTYLFNLFVMEWLKDDEEKRMDQAPTVRSATWINCFLRQVRKSKVINGMVREIKMIEIQLNLMKHFTMIIPDISQKWHDGKSPDDQTFLALLAAVFIDSGFDIQPARDLFAQFIGANLPNFLNSQFEKYDPKYYVIKCCESKKLEPPRVEKSNHQEYNKPGTFEYRLVLTGELLSKVCAATYEEAEEPLYIAASKIICNF